MMMYVFYYLEQGDTIIASNGFTKRKSHSVVIDNTYVHTVGGSSCLDSFGTTSTLYICSRKMMTRRKDKNKRRERRGVEKVCQDIYKKVRVNYRVKWAYKKK